MEKPESFLVFCEGEHRFGLNLDEVERIEKAVYIEKLLQAPDFVKGVLNYHGELLPIVDIRRIFRLAEREDKLSDIIIIARTGSRVLGIWVERVEGVVEKSADELEDAQRLFLGLDYVKGIFKYQDNTVLINDLDKFLTDKEIRMLQQVIALHSPEHRTSDRL